MHLRVSSISSSGGCAKRLFMQIQHSGPGTSTRRSRRYQQNESQALGVGIHRIIQYVLEQESSSREEIARLVSQALIQTRVDLEVPPLLEGILGEDYLRDVIHDRSLVNTWKEGSDLLRCAMNLLHKLETQFPESEGAWEISAEDRIHEIGDTQRPVFGESMPLHGDVDLVFRWENIHVLGELKTGRKKDWKVRQWKCQVAIYMDVWKALHPECQVGGVIIHRGLRNGYESVNLDASWLADIIDPEETEPGEHCRYCDQRFDCPSSFHGIVDSIR